VTELDSALRTASGFAMATGTTVLIERLSELGSGGIGRQAKPQKLARALPSASASLAITRSHRGRCSRRSRAHLLRQCLGRSGQRRILSKDAGACDMQDYGFERFHRCHKSPE